MTYKNRLLKEIENRKTKAISLITFAKNNEDVKTVKQKSINKKYIELKRRDFDMLCEAKYLVENFK